MALLDNLKQEIYDYVHLRLGGQMVDVELDPQHYSLGLDRALSVYRQRAANSVEESHAYLELAEGEADYVLDKNIMEVRQIYRRTVGQSTGASNFEPFEAGYMNSYLLQQGRVGGLATYDLYAGYQELTAKMFGGYIQFNFNRVTKQLNIIRNPRASGETIMLRVYNHKPAEMLLQDHHVRPWIEDYSLAMCKFMLGEARSKFATIAGPQGGTTLNGDTLKAEAQSEMDKLEEDLKNFVDGSVPMSFIIG